MAYADFEFYMNQYKGARISVQDFEELSERASDYIDYITMGRATDTDVVKRACCAMAEALNATNIAKSVVSKPAVSSESVGSYSVSYRSSAEVEQETNAVLYSLARYYLGRTGLLYRGGGC